MPTETTKHVAAHGNCGVPCLAMECHCQARVRTWRVSSAQAPTC